MLSHRQNPGAIGDRVRPPQTGHPSISLDYAFTCGNVLRINLSPEPHLLGLARLAARFTRYRVPYCAIGGFATAMYLPQRRPDDIDLIIGTSLRAGTRAAAAIASLTLDPEADVSASAVIADPQLLADGDQLVITTAYGTLHVLGAHLPDSCDRAAIIQRRRWFIQVRYPVAVCRLDDLLRIKQAAGHGRDAADVAQLLAAHQPRG